MFRTAALRCRNMRALGLDPSRQYSAAELKDAFRAKAKAHHPDVSGGNEAKFREVQDAYQAVVAGGYRSSSSTTGASYASGDEAVYGARRPYSDMYATWHPEESAAQRVDASPEGMKWYGFRETSADGFEVSRNTTPPNATPEQKFRNPYGGPFSGPQGHQRDDANDSTRSFYRSCGRNGSYSNRYAGSGFTADEISQAVHRNRLIIVFHCLRMVVFCGCVSYILYCLLFKQDTGLRMAEAAKRSNYPADYVDSLPDRQQGHPTTAESSNRATTADLYAKNAQRMAAELEKTKKAGANRSSYAVSYRGQPFSAEGLEQLRQDKVKKSSTAQGNDASATPQPVEMVADDDQRSYDLDE